jgi:sugar lactone lactonase YvrE
LIDSQKLKGITMKLKKLGLSILTLQILSSCSYTYVSSVDLSSDQPFYDLEQEYSAFSTKALTQSYLKRKIIKWLDNHDGPRLTRELAYARFKHPLMMKEIVKNDTDPGAFYSLLTGVTAVSDRRSSDPAFDTFVNSLNPAFVLEGIVSTVAGSSPGYVDAQGTLAQFRDFFGIAVDHSGNIFVAEYYNQVVRKIDSLGFVTTVAGNSSGGYNDATGTDAQFSNPRGIAADGSGNLFVADRNNHRIRKIDPSGVVTTFAGSDPGFVDATGTLAQFNNPFAIAVDESGNLYVSDKDNHSIRKIDSSGVVTTIAGNGSAGYADGTGTDAQFNIPAGLAVDSDNNIYVSDLLNLRIRKIDPTGVVTTIAGDGTVGYLDGTGTNSEFAYPDGLAVDSTGNIFIADQNNHRIRKIDSSGVVTTVAGNSVLGFNDGIGTLASFIYPAGIAVDQTGILYVADTTSRKVRKIR